MKIGVIGSGRHGSRYAGHLARGEIAGLALGAVCRRSPEVFDQAGQWDCQGYQDWRLLVDDPAIDAIILALPPMRNLEVVRLVVTRGKPLLIEKPLAGTVADAQAIVRLAAECKVPLTVGQTLRYNGIIQALRRELPHMGRLYSLSANQRIEPSTLAWHMDPDQAGAGVSLHTAVHVFDAIRFITGLEIRRIMALARRRHNTTLEDLVTVLVELDEGVVGTVDCSKVSEARSGRLEFVCERGHLAGEQIHHELIRTRGTQKTLLDPGPPVATIVPLLQDWAAFLRGERDNPVSPDDGYKALRCCHACLQSAASDCWVTVA